jgi:alpha-glucosidase
MALVSGVAGAASSTRSPDAAALNARRARRYSVVSPNRRLRIELEIPPVDAGVPPTWALSHRGNPLMLPGALGLRLANGSVLGTGAQLRGRRRARIRDRWRPLYGTHSEHADRYDELTLELESASGGIAFAIIVRAYDEGVALRYAIRESSLASPVLIAGEDTHFRLPGAARVHASRDEGEYFETDPAHVAPVPHPELTASCDPEPLADIPLSAQLPDGITLVVTESDRRSYPRLMLRCVPGDSGALVTHLMRFPGRATGYSGPGETPAEMNFPVPVPFATPWRVVIVGERPADVIDHASLVQTLAAPNLLRDTAWLRPGRAFRSFRDNTTRAGLECVDFAVRRRLEYIEFDAHWYGDGTDPSDATTPVDGLDIRRVIEYAREHNVGVILYVDRMPAMR